MTSKRTRVFLFPYTANFAMATRQAEAAIIDFAGLAPRSISRVFYLSSGQRAMLHSIFNHLNMVVGTTCQMTRVTPRYLDDLFIRILRLCWGENIIFAASLEEIEALCKKLHLSKISNGKIVLIEFEENSGHVFFCPFPSALAGRQRVTV